MSFIFFLYEKGDFYLPHTIISSNSSRKIFDDQLFKSVLEKLQMAENYLFITQITTKYTPHKVNCFFKSDELLHEALLTQATRMSITGY
jgi:hypothetical protein